MKLAEALQLAQEARTAGAGQTFSAFIACGFMPLHLETFLVAHLHQALPGRVIRTETGSYGDLVGSLEKAAGSRRDGVVVVVEWPDLDPRLGLRALGAWGTEAAADIQKSAATRLEQLLAGIRQAAGKGAVAVSLPTVPMPPVVPSPGWQESRLETSLREAVRAFASALAEVAGVKVVSGQRLDAISPPGERLDVESELHFGFSYTLPHASALAELLALNLAPPARMKGLITDLDETLWRGILAEIGPDAISWDLEHGSQAHGLYQLLLQELADAGVLVAVATRNDPDEVEQTFRRDHLVLKRDSIFPLEAGWGPKSASVERILQAWNVGADSVAFIDDSAAEIAEVRMSHPDVRCIRFPDNAAGVCRLLHEIRDLFGKDGATEEDRLRRDSLRARTRLQDKSDKTAGMTDEFLQQAEAEITLCLANDPTDQRALELVNKTNQFNLNGRRYTDAEWRELLARPDTLLLTATYRDKYGPLGKISVMAGTVRGDRLTVHTWVLSCRAFSRRIEHQCLRWLFDQRRFDAIALEFVPTDRNHAIQRLLKEWGAGMVHGAVELTRSAFTGACPRLCHKVKEVQGG